MKKQNKIFLSLALATVLPCALSVTAFATGTNDPLAVINNLSDFIFGLIRAVGGRDDPSGLGHRPGGAFPSEP